MAKLGKACVRIIPRSSQAGDIVMVKTRLIHPQDNGRIKTSNDRYPPAYFITDFVAYYGEDKVIEVKGSTVISENPFFNFNLKVTKSAPLKVVWKDNRKAEYSKTENILV